MPKRRRLLTTPIKNKLKAINKTENERDDEVWSARGRLKGALRDVVEPAEEIYEDYKKEGYHQIRGHSSDEDSSDKESSTPGQPKKLPYVLKLYDRSVELSQFKEDTPLYPICRAWIANQPKMNYTTDLKPEEPEEESEDSILLPGPSGPPISRIPELLPEQRDCSKDNINLNYKEVPLPSPETLLTVNLKRWVRVRRAWQLQAAQVESRYHHTQRILMELQAW